MFNVCPSCGEYRPERDVRADEGVAVCPCGDVQAFRPGPLLVVGGPSATGKSTILNRVARMALPAIPLDADILWQDVFRDRVGEYADQCLRLAKNIGLAGKPVVLFGAGLVVPDNIDASVERRYFIEVHRLGLVCEAKELQRRLRARPAWRGCSDPDVIAAQLDFDTSLRRLADVEAIDLIDTSTMSEDEATQRVVTWVHSRVSRSRCP